ncbi:MAG TPA: hypothetical protein VKD26_06345 [Streptosporangiaceae bacterium]|nr:hypothetical protein [Streptosporangiaceae bacterium]
MDERDLAAGAADLERLGDEMDGRAYALGLVTGQGRRPHLTITRRSAGLRTENVYTDGTHFYWAEQIAAVADVAAAAAAIDRVLRILDGNRR